MAWSGSRCLSCNLEGAAPGSGDTLPVPVGDEGRISGEFEWETAMVMRLEAVGESGSWRAAGRAGGESGESESCDEGLSERPDV